MRRDGACRVFGKISESELKKMHDDFVVACCGKVKKGAPYSARPNSFDEIRAKHPNAYRPWSQEQDEELKKLFTSGRSTKDLMEKFGRKKGGITARLEKLGLR